MVFVIFINIGPIKNFEKIKSGENFKNGEKLAMRGGYVRLFCQNIQNRGPTYLKEGLCTLKRVYVVQRGAYIRALKRAYVLLREPTNFKEGLRTSKRAYVL